MVQRVRLVWTVKVFGCFVRTAVNWLILPEREIYTANTEPLARRQVDVQRKRIFALILRMLREKQPVLFAVNRSREVGQRIRTQDAEAVRARHGAGRGTSRCRDDVAGKRQTSFGIDDDSRRTRLWEGFAVKDVVGIEKFAEISLSHLEGRNSRHTSLIRKDIPHPFLAPVPEKLRLIRVDVPGNVERPTDVVSKLVVVDRSGDTLGGGRIVLLPWICVQDRVADIFVCRAMKRLRPALWRDADLTT